MVVMQRGGAVAKVVALVMRRHRILVVREDDMLCATRNLRDKFAGTGIF